jgi:hypothetical protein
MTPTPAARRAACLAIAAAAFGLAGCGPSTGTISGTVTLNGTPLDNTGVSFISPDGTVKTAMTGADGSYRIFEVPAGPVQVIVQDMTVLTESGQQDLKKRAAGPARPKANKIPIPTRYGDSGTSGLSLTVKSGENKYDIPLTP